MCKSVNSHAMPLAGIVYMTSCRHKPMSVLLRIQCMKHVLDNCIEKLKYSRNLFHIPQNCLATVPACLTLYV